jgi:uncharacterized protein (DUF433 family)
LVLACQFKKIKAFDLLRASVYNVYIEDAQVSMPKTSIISTRLEPQQAMRLARKARQLGRSSGETTALLIEEGLRRDEYAFVDFRDSPVGRQAYIQGSTLAVWEVVWIARGYRNNVEKTATHLRMSPLKVRAAISYAQAFPDEIEIAIREHHECDFASLSRLLPQAELFPAPRKK